MAGLSSLCTSTLWSHISSKSCAPSLGQHAYSGSRAPSLGWWHVRVVACPPRAVEQFSSNKIYLLIQHTVSKWCSSEVWKAAERIFLTSAQFHFSWCSWNPPNQGQRGFFKDEPPDQHPCKMGRVYPDSSGCNTQCYGGVERRRGSTGLLHDMVKEGGQVQKIHCWSSFRAEEILLQVL